MLGCALSASPAATVTPEPTATLPPVPTPEPSPTPTGPSAVRTTLQVTCQLGILGAELVISYNARVEGPAYLRRVRVMVNGAARDDSGAIYEKLYVRELRVGAAPGRSHSVQLAIEAPDAAVPTLLQVVRCPGAPGPRV
jgi:hypothetical protein